MGLSKWKHLKRYMTPFELDYRRFERQPQIQQLSLILTPKIDGRFETLETTYIYINLSHSMIEPILNKNFVNTSQHQNGLNQRQHTHKNTSQQHKQRNTNKQYQHKNTSQKYQHINTSQQYQHISFQRPSTSSIPYLKEKCIGCGLNNKGVR